VKLASFSAEKKKSAVDLRWITTEESNMNRYEVQRSSNGRDFSTIQTVPCRNSFLQTSYSATDNQPKNGANFYRLKMLEKDGTFTYSKIISIRSDNGNLITVYPNPWNSGMPLQIMNPGYEKLKVYFINAAGQTIGLSFTNTTSLPADILRNQKGIFYYRVVNDKGDLVGTGNLFIN
jgi:hypothetical protein